LERSLIRRRKRLKKGACHGELGKGRLAEIGLPSSDWQEELGKKGYAKVDLAKAIWRAAARGAAGQRCGLAVWFGRIRLKPMVKNISFS
jgi:hypothetical protein